MLSESFVAAARSYIGVTYRHLGRGEKGIDCAGLILRAAWDAGFLRGVDYTGYRRHPEGQTMRRVVERHFRTVPMTEMAVGDVLLFTGVARMPCHLAVVTEVEPRPMMVHAWSERGRVVEHGLEGFRFPPVGCFRLPEFC